MGIKETFPGDPNRLIINRDMWVDWTEIFYHHNYLSISLNSNLVKSSPKDEDQRVRLEMVH